MPAGRPAPTSKPAPAGKSAPAGRGGPGPPPTVLLVDDDAVLLRLLATTFRGGARVLQARTAAAGLQLARAERPAVVFLDVRLGGEDGVRLCRRLKAEPETSATRVYMLSADDRPETRRRAREAGADGFFAKPFSPLALWRALDERAAP